MLLMTFAAYRSCREAADTIRAGADDEALLLATATFTGPEPVVAVDEDNDPEARVRFLRRDTHGAFIALQDRPPIADALDLLPHPEGGWYRETWSAPVRFEPVGYDGERSTATGIYFLLGPGEESVWHVVRSDEVWLWHRGGPLTLLLGGTGDSPEGIPQMITLGPAVEGGEVPQALVPAGTWQAAHPAAGREVLVSCVVSPGFDFADFRAV